MKYSHFSVTACSIVALMQAWGSPHPTPPPVFCRSVGPQRAEFLRSQSRAWRLQHSLFMRRLTHSSFPERGGAEPGPRSAPPPCSVRPRSVPPESKTGRMIFLKTWVTLKKSNSAAASWFQNSWALLAAFLLRIWEDVLKPEESLDSGWKSNSIFESWEVFSARSNRFNAAKVP